MSCNAVKAILRTSTFVLCTLLLGVTAARAATIGGTPATTVRVGQAYSFTPTASYLSGRHAFAIWNKPAWASFSASTGRLSGTPSASNVGTSKTIIISLYVRATNSSIALPGFTITVTPTSSGGGPTISGTPPTQVQAGQAYSFTPTVNNPTGQALSFAVTNKPAWANFSIANGQLSGTPSTSNEGTFSSIGIQARTATASASLPAFAITVTQPTVSPPPPPTTATPIFSFPNFASNLSSINLGDAEGVLNGAIELAGIKIHDAGQAWYATKQNITAFTTDFKFTITANGYGECFVIQNDPRGFGAGGDSNGLGYFAYSENPAGTAIGNSIAIAFNATPNGSSGSESYTGATPSMTGLYLNGGLLMDNGIMPVQDLIPQGINLQSGDVVSAHVVYDGAILSMALTDTVTGKQAYFQWPVNIPAVVGGNTAYIGFTGGTINPVPLLIDSWSWWQGYNTRLASPTFSPAAGSYTSSQSVTISAPTGATIYYTTNGKPPTTASSVYSGPITVSSNEVVQAIAAESGYTSSEPTQGNYQIQAAGSPIINFASGFASASGLMLTAGSARISTSDLLLTDQTNSIEIGSGFYAAPVNVQSFTTQFTLQSSGGGNQNTLLFVIQNQTPASADTTGLPAVSGGPYAFGFENYGINTPDGGYAGISTSVGVKFDTWNGGTTGLFTNGETPYEPQTTITGIDLTSGHPIACTLSYNGSTLTLSMKDTVTNATFSTNWSVDIPTEVGADTAYVGFTASLYTGPSQQEVTAWTFAND